MPSPPHGCRLPTSCLPIPRNTCAVRPEAGARCRSAARRELGGGCWVTGIPTATMCSTEWKGGTPATVAIDTIAFAFPVHPQSGLERKTYSHDPVPVPHLIGKKVGRGGRHVGRESGKGEMMDTDLFSVHGKTAIVTGASSGLG